MQENPSINEALPGIMLENSYQRLPEHFFKMVSPNRVKTPKLVKFNHALAVELGLEVEKLNPEILGRVLSGDVSVDGSQLLSMAYSGHQFGHFNPYMGDGRAALIGEILDKNGKRRDLQLKGSGRTPFSKSGDGKSALGPVMREYIVSEAMHAFGVPTTRSLSIATTGEYVFREGAAPGAVLSRVAASHLRIGTFQYFAARGDIESVKTLADYAIDRHFPELKKTGNPYLSLLDSVTAVQANLVAKWMSIGFIHGVMNTDNMTISGETIDYGPCAFMDYYDHNKVYSSIDREGRYAYGSQPNIAQWNLARLAECLLPLVDKDDDIAVEKAKASLDAFSVKFMAAWAEALAPKFGLSLTENGQDEDRELMRKFLALLQRQSADFTGSFRLLTDVASQRSQATENLKSAIGQDELFGDWVSQWQERLGGAGGALAVAASKMQNVNPIYIPRNHLIEEAIVAGEQNNDFGPMEQLLERVSAPYDYHKGSERFEQPPTSDEEVHQTFCGT